MTADPLVRLLEDITSIRKKVDQLAAKAEPATEDQVQKIIEAARRTPINLNSQLIAQHLLPHLKAGLPTMENLQQMRAQHVEAIEKAGQEAAEKIHQASRKVPSFIGFSDTIFGCTTQKAFLLWISIVVIPVGGLGYLVGAQRARAEHAEAKLIEVQRKLDTTEDFARWTIEKYPKVFETWKRRK